MGKMETSILARSPSSNYRRIVLVVPRQPCDELEGLGNSFDETGNYLGESPQVNMICNLRGVFEQTGDEFDVVFSDSTKSLVVPRIQHCDICPESKFLYKAHTRKYIHRRQNNYAFRQ